MHSSSLIRREYTMGIQWACHVCGRVRDDRYISVYTTDRSKEYGLPSGTMSHNVRYCNDNKECIAGASEVDFFSPKLMEKVNGG